MARVLRSDQAEADLFDLLVYLRTNSPRAAFKFKADFETKCQVLAQFPMMGRDRDELSTGLRSTVISPYVVYFRPLEDGIEIIRVLHGARDVSGLFE